MSGNRVLIVEDEGVIAENIKHILEVRGYFVVAIANSGKQALDYAVNKNPEIILMDIILKGDMDGVSAVNQIKEKVDIPVVYLTAHSDEKTIERVKATGPYGYVLKPINKNELYSTIEIALTRHEMEIKLKKSEASYRQLATAVEQATEDIILTDIEGKIQYVNPAFELITGYSEDEAKGKNPSFLKSNKHEKEFYQQLWNTITKGEVWTGRIFNKKKNGEEIIQDSTISPIRDEEGEITGYVGVRRDVTKQVEMEVQLIQAQKMDAVGTLASGLAHDFNNVLGGIVGSISLLEILLKRENLQGHNKIFEYLDTAKESSSRATDMIKQVLSLSRKQELQFTSVNVNDSLKHVLKICEHSFPKSVKLQFHFTEIPLVIHADENQIEQIILNLCVNASHAMTVMKNENEAEGGTLTLEIDEILSDTSFCRIHPDSENNKKYVKISVIDDGIGMNDELKKRIFEPFFTTKESSGGTGLGLAMVYNIIKQHKGFVDVFSEEGIGTTINVFLPEYTDEKEEVAVPNRDSKIIQGSGSILVIDDEDTILYVAEEMLNECGYNIVPAKNGDDGIRKYKKYSDQISAVILDMSMPGMSGFDVYKKLKKINKNVKVLVSSGFSQDKRIKKSLDHGAGGFLQKPYTLVQLSHALEKLINLKK